MIDTHAHLDGEEFAEDLSQVIARAREAGIESIFVPNINGNTLPHLLEVCDAYPGYLYPMIGLHPEDVDPTKIDIETTLDQMEQTLAQNPQRFVAVGEIGLDFYWDDTYRDLQIDVFRRQVEWGIRYHLPLMIHARNAHAELVSIMQQYCNEGLSGVFHCFTGTADEACALLSFPQFALGIGGVLTFKKSQLPDVLREAVPLSRIVLETDAPYMAPVPHRGKRNESAYVSEVASRLAEIYGVSLADVVKTTNFNVARVFKFDAARLHS